MKIGIEGQRLFRKKKHGMDMVALELIKNLQEIDHENEYVIFVKPDEDNSVLSESANFRICRLEGGSYPLWEQISLPRAAKNEQCDILHCTSNTAPIFSSIPMVVTLHDIIYMEKSYLGILNGSGTSYQKFGNLYRRAIVPKVIKKSRKIITVSNFERKRIADFFGMSDDNRLVAVHNGVGEHFKPVTDRTELERVKQKYRLPEKYFFFLGNTDPKKNTKGTLKAFIDFSKKTQTDYQLVMLDYDKPELNRILTELGAPEFIERIHLTGYVVNTDLPAIYAQCKVFLYPSLRESFGIPILEAMGSGAPVITSNTSSMPEIAGKAAMIIDPFNPDEIGNALEILTTNTDARNELIEAGLKQAAAFSWKSMAEKVLALYHEVYSQSV